MTIRHVVSFRWNDTVSADQVDAVTAALAALPNEIEAIEAYTFGPDAGLVDGNMDYVVVADFADGEAFMVYRDHPAHQRFIADHIAGKVAERAATQFPL